MRKIKHHTLRYLIVLEYLYMDTNKDNPTTYEKLVEVVKEHGFEVTYRSVRRWVEMFISEMGYPIKKRRKNEIAPRLELYWED